MIYLNKNGVCTLCQAEIVPGGHSWMGDCSGCVRSVNFCTCTPVRPAGISKEKWHDILLWYALYGTGKFKWDDGCLDDAGSALLDKIKDIITGKYDTT